MHVLPQTIWLVFLITERNRFGEGVNRLGSIASSVMVGRNVAVKVGTDVFVTGGVPVGGVVVASAVLITKRSTVLVGSREKGVAVGWGDVITWPAGVCRNGIEIGSPLQPARREISNKPNNDLFITPLH